MITHIERPVLTVTRRGASAWPTAQSAKHAVRRSYWPARGDDGQHDARFSFDHAVAIRPLGLVTLTPSAPSPMPSMQKGTWSFAGPTGAADYWHEIRTAVTHGVTWLKGTWGTVSNQFVLTTTNSYNWDPGIWLQFRPYAPYYDPTVESNGYVKIDFLGGPSYANTWLTLLLLHAGKLDSGGDTLDQPGLYVTIDSTNYSLVGPIDSTPGRHLQWVIRQIGGFAVLSGTDIDGHRAVELEPDRVYNSGSIRLTLGGAGCIFHATGLEYAHPTGYVYRTTPAANPPHANAPTTFVAHTRPRAGTGVTALTGEVILTGTARRSPLVYGWTEYADATLNSTSESVTAVAAARGVEVRLTREGRGQSARVAFVDKAAANTAALEVGEVVRVAGKWQSEGSAVTLFQGRVASPAVWAREDDGWVDDPVVTLEDDAILLERKTARGLDGSFAGVTLTQALTSILSAAEISGSRLTCPATTNALSVYPPWALSLSDPFATLLDAFDLVVRAVGMVWRITPAGQFEVNVPSAFGTARGTLDDTNANLADHVVEVEYETGLPADFANAVWIRDVDTGRDAVYAPTPAAAPRNLYWLTEQDAAPNPILRARRLYDERCREDRMIAWSQWVDFAAMPIPWDTYTTGTLANTNIPVGAAVRVEEATYRVDCGIGQHGARVHLIGKITGLGD